jgi:hypothetical protein
MWKEVALAYFEVVSRHLLGGSEEKPVRIPVLSQDLNSGLSEYTLRP